MSDARWFEVNADIDAAIRHFGKLRADILAFRSIIDPPEDKRAK
jgi:hypothetical protein